MLQFYSDMVKSAGGLKFRENLFKIINLSKTVSEIKYAASKRRYNPERRSNQSGQAELEQRPHSRGEPVQGDAERFGFERRGFDGS